MGLSRFLKGVVSGHLRGEPAHFSTVACWGRAAEPQLETTFESFLEEPRTPETSSGKSRLVLTHSLFFNA